MEYPYFGPYFDIKILEYHPTEVYGYPIPFGPLRFLGSKSRVKVNYMLQPGSMPRNEVERVSCFAVGIKKGDSKKETKPK